MAANTLIKKLEKAKGKRLSRKEREEVAEKERWIRIYAQTLDRWRKVSRDVARARGG